MAVKEGLRCFIIAAGFEIIMNVSLFGLLRGLMRIRRIGCLFNDNNYYFFYESR